MRFNRIEDLPEQHRGAALAQLEDWEKPHAQPVRVPDTVASRPATPTKSSEHDEQVALFQWAALHSLRWPCLAYLFAIPNGGKRATVTAMRLKAEGVKAGVPDVLLPWPVGGWCGLWIEMKYGSNKTTAEQRDWLAWLGINGYKTAEHRR